MPYFFRNRKGLLTKETELNANAAANSGYGFKGKPDRPGDGSQIVCHQSDISSFDRHIRVSFEGNSDVAATSAGALLMPSPTKIPMIPGGLADVSKLYTIRCWHRETKPPDMIVKK
jgi:hypothetical protein